MNKQQFVQSLLEKGIILTEKQIIQFDIYFQTLVEWNQKMNLTAITEEEDVYLKHFYDSVSAAFFFPFEQQSICDIGAGAGFPSIPLKICFPELQITIVDSLNKRIQFLNHLIAELNLQHVKLSHNRAETFGRLSENREQFDIVTARAVARMSILSEYCLPLVKKGGHFIAYKATHVQEELLSAEKAIAILGGKLNTTHLFLLPEEESERHLVVMDKVRKTLNKYPRRPGIPSKEPFE